MKKSNLCLAAFVSTMLISGAYAQTAAAPAASPVKAAAVKSDAKRDASNEKHIKDLHAKLQITAAEETLWGTVADTMRANTKAVDMVVDKREAAVSSATAIDDLNAYAEIAQSHADSVKKLSVAFAPLYAAMPDAQKKVADAVFTQREQNKKMAKAN